MRRTHCDQRRSLIVANSVTITTMPAPNPSATVARTPAEASSLVALQNVSKSYSGDAAPVRALDHVSLEIHSGELVALVGRSGCGKSTLLNLAGAMDFPSSGDVLLEGVSTSSLDDTALTRLRREKVGFIFQSFQLLHTLSVVENVELPLLLAGTSNARSKALNILQWVELDTLAERMPHQLSGGQMQRVAIARALIHEPHLLLADEPTGNLDSTTGDVILQLLRRVVVERRSAVVMATHSAESTSFADRVIHMRDGHIESIAQQAVGQPA